jgi:hypothetical protein
MSESGNTNRLLEAVEALTRPTSDVHIQTADSGEFVKLHKAEHLPLLHQLRDAVTPSTNTAAGSVSLKSTRNLVDSDALYRYALITSAIGDWCRIAKVEPTHGPHKDAVVDLQRWYVGYTQYPHDDTWHLSELRKWAATIRALIEPKKQFYLETPCPICDKRSWVDHDGNEMLFPLLVQYCLPKGDESLKPTALCRACNAVWQGFDSIEELSDELNEKNAG